MSIFDGRVADKALLESTDEAKCSVIGLVTQCNGVFVVLYGCDTGREPFTDGDIASILNTFDTIVDSGRYTTPESLREGLAQALGPRWNLRSDDQHSPFDVNVYQPSRMIHHIKIDGWSFEPRRIAFKTEGAENVFGDLKWLELKGESQAPMTFQITDNWSEHSEEGVDFDFALFCEVLQAGGKQKTRVIIDPKYKNRL